MRIIILFFLTTLISCCKDVNLKKELKNNLDEYELLKKIILMNYSTIDSQLISYNKYTEVKTLNNLQVNSLFPQYLRDSIYSVKKDLGIDKIILASHNGILFTIRKDEFIGRSEIYYLVYSSDSTSEAIIYRNFSFTNKERIDNNWYLAKETTSLSY